MLICTAYEFLFYLSNKINIPITISALQINCFSELLRTYNIKCDFSRHSFEFAEVEYPNIFIVQENTVTINPSTLVYHNSNSKVVETMDKLIFI